LLATQNLSWIPTEDSEKLLGVQVLIAQTVKECSKLSTRMVMANCKSPDGFSTDLQGELGTGLRERDGVLEETNL
jgi:hypothetical protein